MRCIKCGTEAAEGDRFCPRCGAGQGSDGPPCLRCGAELRPDSTYCARCGVPVPVRKPWFEQLSKPFFMGSMVGGWVLGYVLMIAGIFAPGVGTSLVLSWFSSLPMIYAVVVFFVLWYKAWESIQDGHVRTTPCRAVGFMFIPFFNLYWMFQAVWGFARDYNSYTARHRVPSPQLNEGLFLAVCITAIVGCFLGWIPFFGWALWIAVLVLVVIIANSVIDGVNRLVRSP